MATFRRGFATLQTYTCVSKEPEAQFCESAVQEIEFTREVWAPQETVMDSLVWASYRTILPLVCG